MAISFMTDTVTRVRPTEWISERGDEFPNWGSASRVAVTGCRLQPMAASSSDSATNEIHFTGSLETEGGSARTGVVTRWKLFFPPDADIDPHDRVEYQGLSYEVDGRPQMWPAPTGTLAHGEVVLRRVDG